MMYIVVYGTPEGTNSRAFKTEEESVQFFDELCADEKLRGYDITARQMTSDEQREYLERKVSRLLRF